MTVTSTYQDAGSMGDRKYAYGTWRKSGAGNGGFIDVPMGRVDSILFTSNHADKCPVLKVTGVAFPYASGQGTGNDWRTQVPVELCSGVISSISGPLVGLWWAFGKRG